MKYTTPATLALAALILSSCGSYLESESGLYDVELHHSIKVPIDGWWSWGKGPVFRDKKSGYAYIAPLDISLVKDDEPELSALLVPQMHDYMVAYLTRVLDEANKENHTRWKITTDPSKADFRMDMAVVSLRPQRPVLRWLFFVGSFFSPIPGTGTIAGKFTNGDICIEFTIRNNRTGELLYAMKDSNRATTRLYKAEAYNSEGQADKNLQLWAQKIARLVRFYTSNKYSNQDISDLINNTSVIRALFYRIETDIEDNSGVSQNAPEIEGPTQAADTKNAVSGKRGKTSKGSRSESRPSAEKEIANSSASSQNAPEIEGPTKPANEKAEAGASSASQNAPELKGPTQAAAPKTEARAESKPAEEEAGANSSAASQNAPEIEAPTKAASGTEPAENSKPRRSRRSRPSEASTTKTADSAESPDQAAPPKPAAPAEAETKPEAKPEPEAKSAVPTPPEAPAASAAPEPAKPAESTDSAAKPA